MIEPCFVVNVIEIGRGEGNIRCCAQRVSSMKYGNGAALSHDETGVEVICLPTIAVTVFVTISR